VNKCYHSTAIINIDTVTGNIYRENCHTMRDKDALCGKEGKLYEPLVPKRTLLQRIFNLRQETKK
jgi:hypothetical protein